MRAEVCRGTEGRARRRGGARGARSLLRAGLAVCAAVALAAGCKGGTGGGGSPSGSGAPAPATDGHSVSPLNNPDGTKPGLAPLTSKADRAAARTLVGSLATKGRGPKTGYDREEFGYAWMDTADGVPWARNGCDTRNDLLKRDGQDVRFRNGSDCVIVSMTLHDPYTGHTIRWTKSHATTVQIDHVMPLSYDWQMGAAHWTKGKREQIANDPLNLLPVDGPANSAKGDSGPAAWLPPDKGIRCAYSVRFAQVSRKYALPVTPADKRMMLEQCGG
ncbi:MULTISPECIES: HNH endonuclease family protein [unclassified Streptomyces]|uniref:HNH endonuclease family protein n=1 Tax=unclassified Streptomyces TaxID=2593676 RepID=UPI002741ABC7|nr:MULTISPECIES: HNH endonuclease family protein [unclassified Streptomyces]